MNRRGPQITQATLNMPPTQLFVPADTNPATRQVGGDHYIQHGRMQPWEIWKHYKLNPWEA